MTKENILYKHYPDLDIISGWIFSGNVQDVFSAMEEYSKQEAIAYSKFKSEYQRIEAMNVRHYQIDNFGGDIFSWVGASDDIIWDAYKKGEQLKRYFEK